MYKFLIRAAALVMTLAVTVPAIASAADITPAQRSAIEAGGHELFRAVVDGNAKGVMAITVPSFQLTTLEGQTLSATELASKWQVMMIEYGGVYGDAKLESATSDGNTITAIYSISAFADKTVDGRGGSPESSLDAIHKIVWIPSGDSFKALSDTVLHQTSTFDKAPSI